MSDERLRVIACTPVSRRAQRKLGIRTYIPPPGASKVACAQCRQHVWIGPRQRAEKERVPETPVLCSACLLPHLTDYKTESLGGRGGDYFTQDGATYVNPPDGKQ